MHNRQRIQVYVKQKIKDLKQQHKAELKALEFEKNKISKELDDALHTIELKNNEILCPITNDVGQELTTIKDCIGLTLIDYNRFYRLFEDKDGKKYVYKVKNPSSHIDELIEIENGE